MKRGTLKRGKGFGASTPQRAKVRGGSCAYCGGPGTDPAHVWPRSMGGCDDADCVIPLCRRDHSAYDLGQLDLLATVKINFPREYAHAVAHAGTEALADRRIRNAR